MLELSITVENINFKSDDFKLIGRVYRPAAVGRFPGVVICHGFPGDSKNVDLAEELAFNGVVALIFYYQGAWGSKGVYRFLKMDPSTRDAVAYLRSLPYIDDRRIGLVSHSMGVIPATRRLTQDPSLKACAFIAPIADISFWASDDVIEGVITSFLESAKGKLDGMTADQLREDLKEILQRGNPVDLIRQVRTPIMVAAGSEDEVTPPDLCRVLYDNAREPKKWVEIPKGNHAFNRSRAPLIKSVVEWLKDTL